MNNNDDKERWETFCKLYDKLSSKEEMRELFEEEIKCFSLYLSHVNQDYVYNATFLPQFKDDFWNFLCAFNKKYKIVEKLFDVAEKYYNVTLKIDRYWMMTVDEKGKIKKSTLSGVDYICEKEMMIECSILYNLKRYTFRRNVRITFEDESLNKVLENLKAFLEKHSSKDNEKKFYTVYGCVNYPEVFGGNYDRYALWLTSQGVVDPHIRDQFSAGGQEEMLLSSGKKVKFPGVYRRVKANAEVFIHRMRQEDPAILIEQAVLQPAELSNRLTEWSDAVSKESTVEYNLSMDALQTYFFSLGGKDNLWKESSK